MNNTPTRWYYDANALDSDRGTYNEMYNAHKHKRESVVGNLSVGEAYGNSYRKNGKETADSFISLLKRVNGFKGFAVVHHKEIDGILRDVCSEFTELDITDAIHLATAISNKCCILKTSDGDLLGLASTKVASLAKKFGVPNFAITRVT